MKKLKELKSLGKYFKTYKWQLIVCSVVIFIANVSYIFTGYLNGAAIESTVNKDLIMAIKYLGIYFLILIVVNLTSRFIYYIFSKCQIKISREIGYDTYRKVMCLPAYAFEEMSSGEIINRVTGDTETIVGSFDQLISIVSNIISSALILIYIFFNSWILGVEILSFIVIYSFIVKHFTKKLGEQNKKRKEENDKFTSLTTESIRGIREVKTLGISDNLTKEVGKIIKKLFNLSVDEYKTGTIYDILAEILKIILECGVFITCAFLAVRGDISITFFVAMTYYIYRYTWILENVTAFSKTLERLGVAVSRINELLSNKLYEDVVYGTKSIDNINGVIEFRDVTFNYKKEAILLDNFNVKFIPNKKIAIVGASGEGKSTLFNLLTRIFDPVSGAITLDGVDIRDLNEESLRKHISIIRQEPFIFNRTIKENFTLLDETLTEEEIRNTCKMAYIDEYIMSLPNKYNTLLGEGGVNLSGGQKQRLSIARTLLKKSKIILFDEATSALDNESQEIIKRAIDSLAKDHTVLIVAHRLSTIIDADIIYVIRKGKVIAMGNHDELMDKCEYYKKLYTTEGKTI